MRDGFQFLARGGVGKNNLRENVAAQSTVGSDDRITECLADFFQGGLAGFDDLPRQHIAIREGNAALSKDFCGSGFAHADAAGEPE